MTNYVMLVIGCILVGLAYQNVFPVTMGNACNVVGIVTMIHAIIWDRW